MYTTQKLYRSVMPWITQVISEIHTNNPLNPVTHTSSLSVCVSWLPDLQACVEVTELLVDFDIASSPLRLGDRQLCLPTDGMTMTVNSVGFRVRGRPILRDGGWQRPTLDLNLHRTRLGSPNTS